jgi:hypothetical protein
MIVEKLVKKFRVQNLKLIETEAKTFVSLDHVTKESIHMLENRIREKIDNQNSLKAAAE